MDTCFWFEHLPRMLRAFEHCFILWTTYSTAVEVQSVKSLRIRARQNLLPYFVSHRLSYSLSLSSRHLHFSPSRTHHVSRLDTANNIAYIIGRSSRSRRRRTLYRESRDERGNCSAYGLVPGLSYTELSFPPYFPKMFTYIT